MVIQPWNVSWYLSPVAGSESGVIIVLDSLDPEDRSWVLSPTGGSKVVVAIGIDALEPMQRFRRDERNTAKTMAKNVTNSQ